MTGEPYPAMPASWLGKRHIGSYERADGIVGHLFYGP
jgi:hypothetical protein